MPVARIAETTVSPRVLIAYCSVRNSSVAEKSRHTYIRADG